jgi:parallel beta-helix repeat protein
VLRDYFALFVLMMTASVNAATIHVNNVAGRDDADGQSSQAAVATFKRAVDLLHPGDTLDIANTGVPYRERLLITREIGTPDHPLIVEGNQSVLTGMVQLTAEKWQALADGVFAYPVGKMSSNLRPMMMAEGVLVDAVKTPEELTVGTCCWQEGQLLYKPQNKQQLQTGDLQASLIDSGVAIQNSSYITVRNLISEYHPNDGFNFHANVRGIILENVIGRYNGDDGCSIHEDGQLFVRNAWFHHNRYGIEDINASSSTYQHVLCEDNEVGVHFAGGIHQLTDSILRNNQTHQLRISRGQPSQYLGEDDAPFVFDSQCVARNVQLQGGQHGLTMFRRAKVFFINGMIQDSEIGIMQMDESNLTLYQSVVHNCSQTLIKLVNAAFSGDRNMYSEGRLLRDNKALDLPTWREQTGADTHTLRAEPVLVPGKPMLKSQPTDGITIGPTHAYGLPLHEQQTQRLSDDFRTLQGMIDDAIQSKASQLKIPAGTYRVGECLTIEGAKNLLVDATDVKLVMTDFKPFLKVHKSSGLTLKGLSVDYDPLPFTQGVVTAITGDGSFEMQLDAGYPAIDVLGKRLHVHAFDPQTHYWKADVYDMYPKSIQSLGNGRLQINVGWKEENLAVGDLIAIDSRSSSGMYVTRCEGENTFRDITIYSSPGLAICGRECVAAQRFENVRITRGQRPVGATRDRLMSGSADGINFAYCRVGPVLENCEFSYMGDDALNVHGALLPVIATPDPNMVVIARLYNNDAVAHMIKPGDVMRIMQRDTFAMLKQVKVLSIRAVEDQSRYPLDFDTMKKTFFTSTLSRSNSRNYTLFEVMIDQEHGTSPMQNVVDFPAFNCPGYIVRNNYFHDHRARGLRLMGNDGLIEGNTFERIGQCAISLGAEMGYWAEAGWVENVMVRNNVIRDVNRDKNATGPGALVLGAIGTFVHTNVKTTPFPGHRKITIENNTIDGSGTAGIYLYAADEAIIRNNTISHVNQRPNPETGKQWGLSVSKPIEFQGNGSKQITNNTIK